MRYSKKELLEKIAVGYRERKLQEDAIRNRDKKLQERSEGEKCGRKSQEKNVGGKRERKS